MSVDKEQFANDLLEEANMLIKQGGKTEKDIKALKVLVDAYEKIKPKVTISQKVMVMTEFREYLKTNKAFNKEVSELLVNYVNSLGDGKY